MSTVRAAALRGVRWLGAATAVNWAVQFVQTLVLARLLSPHDFGLMGLAAIVVGFAQSFQDMGFGAIVVRRRDLSQEQLATLYSLNLATGVALAAVVSAVGPLMAWVYDEPMLTALLPVVGGTIAATGLVLQLRWLCERDMEFDVLAAVDTASGLVSVGVTIGAAVAGVGVWALVAGHVAGTLVGVGILYRHARAAGRIPSLRFVRRDLDGMLTFGAYQIGERCINYFNSRVDQLIIAKLAGATALGYFTFAFNLLSQVPARVNPIVTRVAFPTFARIQHDIGALRGAYVEVVGALGLVNAPLAFGLAAVAPVAVPVVFGAQWLPAVWMFPALAGVVFLRSLANPQGALSLSLGRADIGFYWNSAIALVMAPGVALGSYLAGVKGVVVALLLLQMGFFVGSYRWIVRELVGARLGPYLSAALVPAGLAVVMCFAPLAIARMHAPSILLLAAQVGVGAVVYIAAVALFARRSLGRWRALVRPEPAHRSAA